MRLLAFFWGIALFLPYPSIPIGTAAGLQLAHLMIMVLLPFTLASVAQLPRAWSLYAILCVPQLVSLIANGLQPTDLNATAASVFALLAIPVTAFVFRSAARPLFAGIAVVFLLHGLVGLLQAWAFSNNWFPLSRLYVNPAFAELTHTWLDTYARYVQRPFGLFPEPSSMMASVAPWVLLAIGSIGERQSPLFVTGRPSIRRFVLFSYSALFVTMIMGASGALLIFSLGAGFLLMPVIARLAQYQPGKALWLIGASALALIALAGSLFERAQSELVASRGSWNERFSSLESGFEILKTADPVSLWLGQGSGQIAGIIERATSLDAVQSWVLSNIAANGLLGLTALVLAGVLAIQAISQTNRPWLWTVTTATWVMGPAVVTAYQDLFGIWGFIAIPLTVADMATRTSVRKVAGRRPRRAFRPDLTPVLSQPINR